MFYQKGAHCNIHLPFSWWRVLFWPSVLPATSIALIRHGFQSTLQAMIRELELCLLITPYRPALHSPMPHEEGSSSIVRKLRRQGVSQKVPWSLRMEISMFSFLDDET